MSDAVREDASSADGGRPTDPTPPVRRRRGLAALAALVALLAVLCAALLPFAPVSVNEPTVDWPRDPAAPESTLLSLTAYRPFTIDATFTCDVVRLAEATTGGVVLSTGNPRSPIAGRIGMIVKAADGRVRVEAMDRVLLDEPIPAGACEYRIAGQSSGLPTYVGATPDPQDPAAPDLSALAQPDSAQLVISRDGTVVARGESEQLPDVDALTSSLTAVPPGGLAVSLRVDDEFTSSPSPLKSVLTWTVVAALLVVGLLLVVLDRSTPRVPGRRWPGWPRLVDLAVPAVLVFWTFVAPATDDDGYYAAMARNSAIAGDVGNYYQLYDQNFTPFTWFYQSLGWWQQIAGNSPVQQRIPALVFGIVTFLALRRVTAAAMAEWAPDRRGVRMLAHAVLGVTFLAWWVPQDMGVRPETVVAMTGAFTLLAVLAAARRRRLVFAFLAFALAGLGFTAHPTGFTLFAPLLAGIPLLWPVVRVTGDRIGTTLRAFAVASGGMVAPVMAFADGALRDFVRGQSIFLSIQGQEGWTSEIQRYTFLLSQIPMGNFAKRSAILVCLVALVWFAVLAATARTRRIALPTPLWYAGTTTALAFALLWLTPSKWSHHFGSLAGVGPVFLALLLVTAVPLTRKVLDGARLPVGVLVAAAGSFVVAIALAWHGPNQWPYAWLEGVRTPEFPPSVRNVTLDSPVLWGLGLVAVAVVCVVVLRVADRRLRALVAVPVVIGVSLLGTTVYTVGTFGLAAVQGVPRESLWAQGLADPDGSDCGAAGVVRVLDPSTAQPLTPSAGLPVPELPAAFAAGAGFYDGNLPQGAAAATVWGSLIDPEGLGADRNAGEMSTAWYDLPAGLTGGAATTVIAAGTLSDGNVLTAVYGTRTGDGVLPAGSEELTDTARDPSWRTLTLDPPDGADVVRLDAVDATGAVHGWLAFSAPVVAQPVPLDEYLPAQAPVGLAWPLAFAYPCQRQPVIIDGITEAPEYAVLWGDEALSGFSDGTWQAFRGGAFAQVPRTQSVLQLAVVGGVDPNIQVYAFGTALARDAYTVTETRRTVSGLAPARP